MKVLLFNGSPHVKGCTFTALEKIADTLDKRGIETEIVHVARKPVNGCMACQKCAETGRCVFDDVVNMALEKAAEADGFVFGSPVYFASPNGTMISFMDRFFHIGDFAHKPAAVVASARRGGCTATVDALMKYPTMAQMPVVSADYWPMVHGNNRDQVLQDEEGIYTMEIIGKNMAWLLKCIESAGKQGIEPEKEEKTAWTNFIR